MKTIKIAVIAMMGMSLGVSAQDETVNGNLTVQSSLKLRNLDNTGTAGLELSGSGTYIHLAGDGLIARNNNKQDLGTDGWKFRNLWLGSNAYIDGNVGIGTSTLGIWKLAVNGDIRAKKIKVEAEWSDFVFYKDFKLPSLLEVENFIKENGHLKDIPSAMEVEKNGIFLGEMSSKLLQKIEELTLYTIEQEKKIEQVEKENESLKFLATKVLELQKRLEKLEKE